MNKLYYLILPILITITLLIQAFILFRKIKTKTNSKPYLKLEYKEKWTDYTIQIILVIYISSTIIMTQTTMILKIILDILLITSFIYQSIFNITELKDTSKLIKNSELNQSTLKSKQVPFLKQKLIANIIFSVTAIATLIIAISLK